MTDRGDGLGPAERVRSTRAAVASHITTRTGEETEQP